MATNQEMAHKFFYSDFNEYNYPHYKNCGYDHDIFISYNTAIARVVEDKHGEKICLLSAVTYSNSTRKHLNYLRWACPFHILYVPTDYGCRDISISNTVYLLFRNLDFYKNSKLTQKANRNNFTENYIQLENLLEHFDIELSNEQKDFLPEYKELFDTLQNSDAVKLLKAREMEKAREQARKQKETLALLLKENTLGGLAQSAYSPSSPLTYEEKEKIRQAINPNQDLSFVWLEGDQYKTSQRINIDKREGDLLLKLYKHGKLTHGYRISIYTVLSVCDDFVKIGCHKIPARNLQELAQ